jgi:2-dehydro-3-deoxygalactonokinase
MTLPTAAAVGIVVDWGTTTLRASLIGPDGATRAAVETPDGIQTVTDRAFEPVLMRALGQWFAACGPLPVTALGMITSRNGWVEVPYVDCPADIPALARGMVERRLRNGSVLRLLPGLRNPAGHPFPDVMRGEETQIVGAGLDRDRVVVLPGTHSKWARVAGGAITGFQTFVTGEVYALLAHHSFIARTSSPLPAGETDWAAFDRGAALAGEAGPQADAFLSLLFGARTGMLDGQLAATAIRDFVSGLVIGHEFRQARACGWFAAGDAALIVGNDGLNQRYARIAPLFGLAASPGPDDAALRGALAIAAAA